jgi:hypothetical protein
MMIIPDVCTNDITHAIQLALAPVFLLTGIAGVLNVMTGRLSRIIDRGRRLAEEPHDADLSADSFHAIERNNLEQRRHLASTAISASTLSAVLVCLVVIVLFAKVTFGLEITWVVSFLFMASTLSLLIGLTFFLREVHMATKTVRIALPYKK